MVRLQQLRLRDLMRHLTNAEAEARTILEEGPLPMADPRGIALALTKIEEARMWALSAKAKAMAADPQASGYKSPTSGYPNGS